jgi:hypothetical protein
MSREPWMTSRTHTDPDCNGSCGGDRFHPSAPTAADDDQDDGDAA